MSHGLLANINFYATLMRIDADLAAQAQAPGCECGGRLDVANFARKPRGGPSDLDPRYAMRFSFCCAQDGCRTRTTPPSVRFLGRRVYLGAVVMLVTAMRHGVTPPRADWLRRLFGVSAWTLARWREWWTESFCATPFWRATRGRFHGEVDLARMPASLVERFGAETDAMAVARTLAFVAPITTASCAMEARIPMLD
jgi:hypothetical protein